MLYNIISLYCLTHNLSSFAGGQLHQFILCIIKSVLSVTQLSSELVDNGVLCHLGSITVTLELFLLTLETILQCFVLSTETLKIIRLLCVCV